jgi:hypothetical protein
MCVEGVDRRTESERHSISLRESGGKLSVNLSDDPRD